MINYPIIIETIENKVFNEALPQKHAVEVVAKCHYSFMLYFY